MKKIKGHFWSPSTRQPVKLGAKRLAVRLALDPEGDCKVTGNKEINFNFKKEIPYKTTETNINKKLRSHLQFYERNPFK